MPFAPGPRTVCRRRKVSGIGSFLAKHQKPDGDLQDIFDDNDKEANTSLHRCSGRIVVCGLWTRLGQITGDKAWIDRAIRLAKAVGPEIKRYEFYNEMMDHCLHLDSEWIPPYKSPRPTGADCASGNAGYRTLEGLVPLYAATHDPEVLALCKASAAYAFASTCFYDLPTPKTHNGIARGGQCCWTRKGDGHHLCEAPAGRSGKWCLSPFPGLK